MLIDANVFVEIGLSQQRQQECWNFLRALDEGLLPEQAYITDFALHAIELLLYKKNRPFLREILLMIHEDKIKVVRPSAHDDICTLGVLNDIELDLDDGFQFMATNKLMTYLITFDKHFKKTHLPTKTPSEVLKEILI